MEIPSDAGIEIIGKGAFAGRGDVVSVTIPEGVVRIDDGAFERCTRLASVTLPAYRKACASLGMRPFEDVRCCPRSSCRRAFSSLTSGRLEGAQTSAAKALI